MTDASAFFDTLVRLEIELWNEIDARLQDGGVTLARFQALRAVAEHDGRARVHEVAQDLGITVGAASKLVDRLEQDGSARREPNPDDRRSSLIALTPDGVRRYKTAAATFAVAAEAALPADLRGEVLDALTRRLDGVSRHLASRGAEATA